MANELIADPALYRELDVPFPNREALIAALDGFDTEFRELRKKYRLPDVYCIIRAVRLDESGKEHEGYATLSCGSDVHSAAMTAWASGREQQALMEALARHRRYGAKASG